MELVDRKISDQAKRESDVTVDKHTNGAGELVLIVILNTTRYLSF